MMQTPPPPHMASVTIPGNKAVTCRKLPATSQVPTPAGDRDAQVSLGYSRVTPRDTVALHYCLLMDSSPCWQTGSSWLFPACPTPTCRDK